MPRWLTAVFIVFMTLPLTLLSLTFYFFFKHHGNSDLIGLYTLSSAALINLLPLFYYLYAIFLES